MTEDALHTLGGRLVGAWNHEATHPALPEGTSVHGKASIEWLEGERFLIWRSQTDHPDFPDSVSILGDIEGPTWHYYDSRGIHRVLDVTLIGDGFEVARNAPEFDQRMRFTLAGGDNTMIGKSQLSDDHTTWNDDLQITYSRSR